MPLNLANYQAQVGAAVKAFWQSRGSNGGGDNRMAVVGGKNLDGFTKLLTDIVTGNGLPASDIHITKAALNLPGFFRATKQWDFLVLHRGRLVAALELKSQVGPSFGNNFNNRCEEAIGNAKDIWTAFREGAFSGSPTPFLGYLMLLEDCPQANAPVSTTSQHFDIFPEFNDASYARRYQLLCEKLVSERLYTAAALVLTPRAAATTGQYREHGLHSLVSQFAAHIAAQAT